MEETRRSRALGLGALFAAARRIDLIVEGGEIGITADQSSGRRSARYVGKVSKPDGRANVSRWRICESKRRIDANGDDVGWGDAAGENGGGRAEKTKSILI